MITEFRILADTEAKTVTLEIYQAGRIMNISNHATVTDALYRLGAAIARVMAPLDPEKWDD
jgi:hypothetical protein